MGIKHPKKIWIKTYKDSLMIIMFTIKTVFQGHRQIEEAEMIEIQTNPPRNQR